MEWRRHDAVQVTSLAFSPDGKVLAVGCEDGGVSAWDVASATRLGAVHLHAAPVWSLAISRGDGALLASGAATAAPLLACCLKLGLW